MHILGKLRKENKDNVELLEYTHWEQNNMKTSQNDPRRPEKRLRRKRTNKGCILEMHNQEIKGPIEKLGYAPQKEYEKKISQRARNDRNNYITGEINKMHILRKAQIEKKIKETVENLEYASWRQYTTKETFPKDPK